mmetsp:Transcript_36651/g.96761  ORF Transcript_36651/g.96761 Transcript_36651/m.96761 type:complete len:152 (-) Transcript_36651:795-1250(-)
MAEQGTPTPLTSEQIATMQDADWKAKLSDKDYRVLRQKGTEPARSGEYDGFYPKPGEGHFVCKGCSNPLYSAAAKFKSGCGWPAFDRCYTGAVKTYEDNSHGMRRIEITCMKCDGHLGHGEDAATITQLAASLIDAQSSGTRCHLTCCHLT